MDLSGTDGNCGKCGHSCLGDGCMNGACKAVPVLTGLNHPTTIATSDGTTQFVYNSGTGVPARCAKTGCANAPTPSWTGTSYTTHADAPIVIVNGAFPNMQSFATFVSLSSTPNTQLYTLRQIESAAVVNPAVYTPPAAGSGGSFLGMAGDAVTTGGDVALQAPYTVWECASGGLCSAGPNSHQYTGENGESAIVIQPGSPGYLLWPSYNNIQYCARGSADAGLCSPSNVYSGSTTTKDASVESPDSNPAGIIAVSATTVYWAVGTTSPYQILACSFPAACIHPRVLVDGIAAITALVADDSGVYYSDENGGTVYGCSDTTNGCGSTPAVVANDLSHPRGIAIDKNYVFITQSGVSVGQGAITRVAR